MKIALFEIQGWEKKTFSKRLGGHEIKCFKEPLTLNNVDEIKDVDIVSVFVYSDLTKAVLDKLKNLKLVTTRSTGFDHIDVKCLKKRKIMVNNVPFYGENTVAEHTFALILALSRNVHKAYIRSLDDNFTIDGLVGFDLKGKTIGVIGAGNIGLNVIKIAKGFGMNVVAFDINQNNFLADVMDFKYVSIDKLLCCSDIISLHVPLNKNTEHLINKKTIKKIKKGALLINTSRGAVVDTDALIPALKDGTLAGAGLDVIEGEEYIIEEKELLYKTAKADILREVARDKMIFKMDNVVFTPHIAFYSHEALERIINTTADNICGFITGKPINVVQG